uniref:Uncharacterized protein n=1 Tax=Romanomermis culicivorax TaxID=13658 RepID=A0A915KJM2_ROMCU
MKNLANSGKRIATTISLITTTGSKGHEQGNNSAKFVPLIRPRTAVQVSVGSNTMVYSKGQLQHSGLRPSSKPTIIFSKVNGRWLYISSSIFV